MIKILHLADLHLGRSHSYLEDKAADRMKEADGVLGRVAEYVLGERADVDVVVIAGDLFESYRPEESLVWEAIRALKTLVDAGKTVITLPGNHDELSYHACVYNTHADKWPGILVTSPGWTRVATVSSEEGPCHFYGLAYQAGVTADVLETSVPLESDGRHVALVHASVDLPSKDRSIHTTSKDLEKLNVDYVALGHVHVPKTFRMRRGLAVYPGLIEGSGFDDPGCGGLVLVGLGEGAPNIEEVPLGTRRIETASIDLSHVDDEDALSKEISARADSELILRARLTGAADFEPSPDAIRGELAGLFYHLEVEEDYALMGAVEVESAAEEETVLGLVIRDLREREAQSATEEEKAVARLALRHAWRAFRGGRAHE